MTPERGENGPVGRSVRRVDGTGKTTGETRFFSDLYPPDVLWVRTLRSEPGPSGSVHARIRALDASKAESAPGVVRVITAKDIPGENSFGGHVQDQPVLCDGWVRFHGDAVALVVAETREAASAALKLIDVDYDPLPALLDPDAAMAGDAFPIGEGGNVVKAVHVERGDLGAGFAEADVIIENTFETPRQTAAFIETESGVARMEGEGGDVLVVETGAQNPFADRREIARSLSVPVERIRVRASPIGGGFGAKDGISMQIHLALVAWLTGRPVRLFWEREESNLAGWKRHPFRISLKTGVKRDGTLTAHTGFLTSGSTAIASSPTTRRPARSGGSARCRPASPWSARWTPWRRPSRWIPWRCASATPSGRAKPLPRATFCNVPSTTRRPWPPSSRPGPGGPGRNGSGKPRAPGSSGASESRPG